MRARSFAIDSQPFTSLGLSTGAVLEAVPVAVLVGDLDGRCCYANAAASTLLRRPPDQLLARPLAALAGDPHAFAMAYRQAIARQGTSVDLATRRGDGTLAPLHWTFTLVRDGEGNRAMLAVVARETGAEPRRPAEAKILLELGSALAAGTELPAFLDLALKGVLAALGRNGGAVVLVDEGSGRLRWAASRKLRPEAEARLSRGRASDLVALRVAGSLESALLTSGDQILGALAVVPEGRDLTGDDLALMGAVANLAAIAVARHHEAERARALAAHHARLHRAAIADQARLAGVLAALPMAVYTVDVDGRLGEANAAARHLAGGPPVSLRGRPCREVFPLRDNAGRLLCDWACPRLRDGTAPVEPVIQALLPATDGAPRTLHWSCAPLLSPEGQSLGWVEVVRDVSNLRDVEAMRQTFLSAVSHELLSPLSIIKGHAETLRDPATRADPALAEGALVAIDEETERLRRLVANLLDAARAASGAFTIQRVPLALGPIIKRAVQRFRGRSRRHRFSARVPRHMPLVLGDRERLESTLYNLLDNAVKYSPYGGRVLARADVHPCDVEVTVEDEGIGIRPEDEALIFQPYYRAESDGRRAASGSGLGLYVCKTIVEALGGRIWAERRPLRGAAFHFTVPRADPDQMPTQETASTGRAE